MVAFLFGITLPVFAAEVSFDSDRMLLVDNERTFVIGLYENPVDDNALREVADSGFNLVQASEDTASLDRLHNYGLYGWINIGGRMELESGSSDGKKQLEETVERYGSHPALLVWEGPDEGLWMCAVHAFQSGGTLEQMANSFSGNADALQKRLLAGYEKMKQLDPHHPVWLNHAAGNSQEQLAAFGEAADIVGADIYPLMPYPTQPIDISRRGLAWVGLCAAKMQGSAPGKPVWMVLQGMSWGDFENEVFTLKPQPGQWPTFEESRFMAYDAIVRGSRGVLYWGTHITKKESECWKGITKVIRELADNQPLLTAYDADVTPAINTAILGIVPFNPGGNSIGVQVLGKKVDGSVWWIVVNEFFVPVSCTLSGLDAFEGTTYTETSTDMNTVVKRGSLTCSLPAYGVHILRPKGQD